MSVAVAKKEEEVKASIPNNLIYEVVKGKPIYYRGYKDVLNGTKTIEEIKMESKLQSWLKAQITGTLFVLLQNLPYEVFTGELGLNLPHKTKRGADLAIYKSEAVEIDEFFANVPPEVVIEIDVAIDTEKQTEMDYVHAKIDDYLNFGVKQVIWIFTKNQKVIVADNTTTWLTSNWDKDLTLPQAISFNLSDIMRSRKVS
ncbi:MAG: Uma2 family endonuclease [Bacteroidota bacterium]